MSELRILDIDSQSDSSDDDSLNVQEEKDNLPWIEKYRPTKLDQIISQSNITSVLRTFMKKECLPHLLFYGRPGVGKTSTITAFAKELYGKHYPFMVLELNASDERGIEVVRNKIINFATSKNIYLGDQKQNVFKLIILDETDAMTHDAQAILRKIIETCTINTRFCLICNLIKNINPALTSRCTKFRFSPLKSDEITKKIKTIAKEENVDLKNSGINTIIKRSNGDMRKVLNMLQSTSMVYDVVNEENVNNCIGYPQKAQIKEIVKSLSEDSYGEAYTKILKIKKDLGLSLNDILSEIHDILVDVILEREQDFKIFKMLDLNIDKIKGILNKIRDIEFNQSSGSTENIQLGALVGVFKM